MEVTTANNIHRKNNKIHPQKFAMLLGCASMMMMFFGFTSAYIIRQASGNWLEFVLPRMFLYSTGVILLSSLTLQISYRAFKKGITSVYRSFLLFSFILGLAFIVMQYMAWQDMGTMGVFMDTNPSGSFVYVISGVHAAHVLGGIGVLTVALVHAFSLKHQVTEKRKLRFELSLIFWHFVDFLWLYILLFFVLQQS